MDAFRITTFARANFLINRINRQKCVTIPQNGADGPFQRIGSLSTQIGSNEISSQAPGSFLGFSLHLGKVTAEDGADHSVWDGTVD